jgi:hypothetical protein
MIAVGKLVARFAGRARSALKLLTGCVLLASAGGAFGASATPEPELRALPDSGEQQTLFDPFLTDLEARTFRFFWETANPKNGLVPDRYPTPSFASIAAVGFGLTAYPIGVERGYISRAAARERVLVTLRFFARAQNEHGFFYHYIDMRSGARANESEVSTVDTSLLLSGMLFCESYFDTRESPDIEIRRLT